MTERENYLRVIHGEMPEWVPVLSEAVNVVCPYPVVSYITENNMIDMYGTKWAISPANGELMVDPYRKVLDDVTKWRDWLDLSDLESYPWEDMAKKDMAMNDPDKATLLMSGTGGELFLPWINMMGMENGLCALLEEPEEIMEFNEVLTEYKIKRLKKFIEYYKPDVMVIGDDYATEQSLFFSYGIFKELYLPYYKRMINAIKEYDIPVEFHLCGKAETTIDDLVEAGVDIWQSAQCINDILHFQKKYGKRLKYNGVWDTRGPGSMKGDTEEMARQGVRDCMDKYANDGTLIFFPGTSFGLEDEAKQRLAWVLDEAVKYGKIFYKK